MFRHIILIFILGFMALGVHGQNELFYEDFNVSQLNEPNLFGEILYQQTLTSGSQFLFNEWTKGNVELSSGRIAQNVDIKYNGYTDELMWLNPSLKIVVLDKKSVSGFSITDPKTGSMLTFKKMKVKVPFYIQTTDTYLQVLHQGKYKLYAFRQIVQSGRVINTEKNRSFELPEIKPKPLYYIELPEGQMIQFYKAKKSTFINLFPNKKNEVKKLLSSQKIRLNHESELVRAMEIIEGMEK